MIEKEARLKVINLSRLEEIKDLRTVWPHEALDFTPWLSQDDNISLLADAVEMDITVDETESSVGDFNVDIFASETGTDRKIIIENQLEDTNHDHLGKLITYASGKSADVVIWVVKHAREEHKAAIEWLNNHKRICLSEYLRRYYPQKFISYSIEEDTTGDYLSPVLWKCTMTWSAYMGLPLSLEGAGKVLGLSEQKLKEGKNLIRYFCVPCKPTKVNGGRTRNLPEHDKEKRAAFVKYNIRDVEAELAIQRRLEKFPVPDFVWEEFWLDQEINDRGIALDMAVVENAIVFDKHSKDKLTAKIQNSENPNSVIQMKAWLLENGIEADTLDKKAVKELIRSTPAHIREVLEIRQKLAKSSVKKYQAMENAVCTDHRARGMFRFYGANRSGRWAGRMIQLQNLPQNHLPDLWEARELVKTGNYEAMEFLYDDIPDTLSQLIRTVFVPREGMKFVVADFSVIEARVLSYLAKEEWRSEVFRNNGDIYCASASAMFGVPVEKHGVNAHLRQKGKIAELALGYGGSVGALTAMGAIEMGLTEDELQPLVDSWRSANPNIVQFWWAVDRCVKKNISTQKHTVFIFYYKSGMLFIELPSGRRLSYVKPKMGVNKFGSESVVYEGIGGTKKWEQADGRDE